ncbi:hypothetical protein EYS14_03920 [Alteromonadaceae bacterium M269]|nr:hypothetical protein EYS14_03920 [Alteromonadaceae bacterium M269]
MKQVLWLLLLINIVVIRQINANTPAETSEGWSSNIEQFESELSDLQTQLDIPGLAYVVIKNGDVIAKSSLGYEQGEKTNRRPFLTSTPLRIASVTKSLTAVVIMQLVEEGMLKLDTSVKALLPDEDISPEITLNHLLTHTSEGKIGETYVYSTSRYALLGKVIEKVTQKALAKVFGERLIAATDMKAFDSPYLGSHAGFVSNVNEMTHYFKALDKGVLLRPESMQRLVNPSRSTQGTKLPVSLGWFAQKVQGQDIVWSFGQDDPDHSGALWVYLPKHHLTLFILANANTLSDPFRLLMGDARKSPFAMSFMRNFVFSAPGQPIPLMLPAKNKEARTDNGYDFSNEWVAHALVDIWTGKSDDGLRKLQAANAFSLDDKERDPIVHFSALRLDEPEVKDSALKMGEGLLQDQPNNRWILLAQGYLLQQRGRDSDAASCFNRILNLPNQQQDFLHRLFSVWSWTALAQITMENEPTKAKRYLTKVINSGIKGESLENAKALLETLSEWL